MFSQNTLPRSIPEIQGVQSKVILDFIKAVEENGLELHSFMFLKNGHVIAEGWWHPYSSEKSHMLFSLSKSFTSTAVGMAVSENLLSIEDTVISYFPEDVPDNIDENLAAMKIKHLLSMSTGHKEDASEKSFGEKDGNWVKGFLQIPVDYEPGTHFVYNTAATYMLSAIMQKITGQTLLQYLEHRLFKPLGIVDPTWEKCPRGINTGGFGLSIKTEDIAKFGQLYLQNGQWNDIQLLNEAWVKEASGFQISNGSNPDSDWAQGYGYQFWRCRHNAYRGDGAFGQYCIVIPELDSVIAITSGLNDMQKVLNLIWDAILPGVYSSILPENKSEHSDLVRKLNTLSLPSPKKSGCTSANSNVTGRSYRLDKNDFNLQKVFFDFSEDICVFKLLHENGEHSINCGFGKWEEQTSNVFGSSSLILASGAWIDEQMFEMQWRLVETPFIYTISCKFEGDTLKIDAVVNVGFGPNKIPTLTGVWD